MKYRIVTWGSLHIESEYCTSGRRRTVRSQCRWASACFSRPAWHEAHAHAFVAEMPSSPTGPFSIIPNIRATSGPRQNKGFNRRKARAFIDDITAYAILASNLGFTPNFPNSSRMIPRMFFAIARLLTHAKRASPTAGRPNPKRSGQVERCCED